MPTNNQILTPTEIDAINLLCDIAKNPHNKQLQLADESSDPTNRPPLRLQNLALPARASACRVVLAVANGERYQKALADNGLSHLQFTAIRLKDHDLGLVFEAAKRVRDEMTVAKAQTGLDRLISEDGCDLNAKAVLFAAERLDPERFGKAADGQEGGKSGGARTVYNIVINAQPCGNLAENTMQTPVIDAESNE